ncbi:MAG: hypothetical protein AB2A00_07620 [Myxococcota bacterium]
MAAACLLVVMGLMAQTPAPSPAPRTTPPSSDWGQLPGDPLEEPAQPAPQAEPEIEEPADAASSQQVARDAYLGGYGMLAPLLILPLGPCSPVLWSMAPLLGGLAGAWAQEKAAPDVGGQWIRGSAAAYAAALARLIITYAGYLVMYPVYLLTLLPYYAGVLATAGIVSWMIVRGQPAQRWWAVYLGGVGAALMVSSCAGFLYSVFYLLPYALAARVSVAAGDAVWNNVMTQQKTEPVTSVPNPAKARLPGERPLPLPLAAALLATSARGAWERSAHLEFLPVVGPLLAAVAARKRITERLTQAAGVSGLRTHDSPQPLVDVLLFSKAFFLSALTFGLPLAALGLAATGAATIATGVVFYLSLYGSLVVAPLAIIAFVATMVIGALALVLPLVALVIDAFTPWMLSAWVLASSQPDVSQPPLEEEAPEDAIEINDVTPSVADDDVR